IMDTLRHNVAEFTPPRLYMSEILELLYVAETTDRAEYEGKSAIRYSLEKKIADMDAAGGAPSAHSIYIEIGNEPNAFPAIPPRLFAKYYGKYWDYINEQIADINANERGPSSQVAAKVMPGGLLIMDGFPQDVLDFLYAGLKVKLHFDLPVMARKKI